MTLNEATERGIERLRKDVWASKDTYVKLDLLGDGSRGPWVHLYSPREQEALGLSTPQDLLAMGDSATDWKEYTGVIAEAEKGTRPGGGDA